MQLLLWGRFPVGEKRHETHGTCVNRNVYEPVVWMNKTADFATQPPFGHLFQIPEVPCRLQDATWLSTTY
eukprot:1856590-Prorocentrum_lima.AAC.1